MGATFRYALNRLTALSHGQRHELIIAAIMLTFARLALWFLPFRVLRSLITRLSPVRSRKRDMPEIDAATQVAWAVRIAARFVPAATCLVRAIATQILLARHGVDSTLRLGVARAEAGEFKAHAWVECRGRVVVGGTESPNVYSILPVMASSRRCRAMED